MNMADMNQLQGLRGRLLQDAPMSRHVSWRAGGVARLAYIPADEADLATFMAQRPQQEPVLLVGLGSNLLVRDGGYDGTVVFLHSVLGTLQQQGERIYAGAGVASPKLARFAALADRVGAEFLAGIPGTIGGALAMNAGCYGSETWTFVQEVRVMDHAGVITQRTPADFEIGYRHVAQLFSGSCHFLGAWFEFAAGDGQASRARIKELLSKRIASQPLSLPNAGSVFRNPPGDHAARLIELCGLKGRRVGGAEVSAKHANFIVNTGGATAGDIERLILEVQAEVARRTGISLVPEVRIVGNHA